MKQYLIKLFKFGTLGYSSKICHAHSVALYCHQMQITLINRINAHINQNAAKSTSLYCSALLIYFSFLKPDLQTNSQLHRIKII